jgi:leader peptidase (prepilin peptidase)/N-methyltransferase
MLVSLEIDAALAGVFGLLVGSFLNVVIYRLPKMLERQWARECAELKGESVAEGEPFNLVTPRSRCRQCGHMIRWYENVPVLSYLVLRGKCSACGTAIGARYPLVELATGALFLFSVWHWGATPAGLAWCGFSAAIVAWP